MTNIKRNTLGIILSGGAGARAKGVDKGLQTFKGRRLIEHVMSSLSPQVNSFIICANRNLADYESFSYPVVCDQHKGQFEGPLAGITAAIDFINQQDTYKTVEQILLSPCDVPNPPKDLYLRLNACSSLVSVAYDGQRRQNLHCLIQRPMWSSLVKFYDNDGRAMHRWLSSVDSVEIDFSDQAECFENYNSFEKMQKN